MRPQKSFQAFLQRKGGFLEDETTPDYSTSPILVVGAGGLGCEVLKTLAMSGFTNLTVIDMDTIEYSNLNRQFLFRKSDVGRPKAQAAAEFVMKRVPGCHITWVFDRLENQSDAFYKQFKIVVSGLDNLNARRWVSNKLCSLVKRIGEDVDAETVIPLVDGGTEGFLGHCMVCVPTITPCLDCNITMFPPQKSFPMCTIASQPRLPEHCVAWASQLAWTYPEINTKFLGQKVDADNPEHVQWIFEKATERAAEKNITGVTYRMTLGVIKNIIPAIASTNSLIAAMSANEAVKFLTNSGRGLDNYMTYCGKDGINTSVESFEVNEQCMSCSMKSIEFEMSKTDVLETLVEKLSSNEYQINKPTIGLPNGKIIYSAEGRSAAETEGNLLKTLEEVGITNGVELAVTCRSSSSGVFIIVNLTD